jgi:hypothetical protein
MCRFDDKQTGTSQKKATDVRLSIAEIKIRKQNESGHTEIEVPTTPLNQPQRPNSSKKRRKCHDQINWPSGVLETNWL